MNISHSSSVSISDEITLEAWIYLHSHTSRNNGIITKWGSANNYNWMVSNQNGNCGFHMNIYGPGSDYSNGSLYSFDTWIHAAFVYSPSDGYYRYYVNGVEVDTNPKAGNISDAGSQNVGIGARSDAVEFFDGLIDEARIYDSALEASQIKARYVEGLQKLHAEGKINGKEYYQKLTETGF